MNEIAENAEVTEDAAELIARARNCTRCGKSTKGHPGPCGTRCSNITNSPEQLRSTVEHGEKMMTPVKEFRILMIIPWSKAPIKKLNYPKVIMKKGGSANGVKNLIKIPHTGDTNSLDRCG